MKRRSSNRGMTREDHLLWKRVADTTTPISRKRASILEDEMARLMGEVSWEPTRQTTELTPLPKPVQAPPVTVSQNSGSFGNPLEGRLLKKLAKGRQSIDARVDLHGMTQDRARLALLDFLQMAQLSGNRIVLVITGKGNEGMGVLRQNVPLWLSTPPFTSIVNGFRESHISHGGEGALYVRVRRLKKPRSEF